MGKEVTIELKELRLVEVGWGEVEAFAPAARVAGDSEVIVGGAIDEVSGGAILRSLRGGVGGDL